MTQLLLPYVSKRYEIDLVRYKKSANAKSVAETTRKNGTDVMYLPVAEQNFCANTVHCAVRRAVFGAVFGAENGTDAGEKGVIR